MATKHIYLKDLHFDNQLWINELSFYKQEIGLLENQLAVVLSRNTTTDATAPAERFQNQFIRQREVIDILAHDIKERENWLVDYAKNNGTAIDHIYFDDRQADHDAIRERMDTFKKIYSELKADFFAFVGKWM